MSLGNFVNSYTITSLTVIGVLILLVGKVYAASRLHRIREFIILSAVAEMGLVFVGLGLGDSNGIVGAGFHFLYQLIVRFLMYLAAMQLIRLGNSPNTKDLTGLGSKQFFVATIFGFSLFSAMGISPFKGSMSKLLIIYSAVSTEHYLLAVLVVLASLIEAGCFLKIFHMLCLGESSEQQQTSRPTKLLLLGTGLLTVLLTLFQEPIMHLMANNVLSLIYDINFETLAKLESHWSWLVLIPYLGGFIVYILGKTSASLRNIVAVVISVVSVVLVWQTNDLDGLSRLFALLMTFVCLLVTLYSTAYFKNKRFSDRYFFFLMIMQASLIGITTTNHLGNFYAFWELMTCSSYFLVIHEQTKEALEAGYKYFMMCTAGAYALLIAAFALQIQVGSISLNVIAKNADKLPPTLVLALALGFLLGFGIKIGLVPVHSWLPAAHPVAPSSISAPMSGILTKIGIYGVLKLIFMVFGVALLSKTDLVGDFKFGSLMAFLGAATLLYGDLKAIQQTDVKKMLAYSTMAQVGEIVIALGSANYLSLVGGLSHVLNHAVMKNLLFLAIGSMIFRVKSQEISKLKGIGKQMPVTSLCFSIGILGIMGLPPFAGFVSKFMMLYGLIETGQWLYAGVILLGGFIGCFYYLRLIKTMYFEDYDGPAVSESPKAMLLPSAGLAVLVVFNGLFPQYALSLIKPAADTVAWASHMPTTSIPNLTITWPLAVVIPMVGGALAYLAGRYSPKWGGWFGVATLVTTTISLLVSNGNASVLSVSFALLIAFVGVLNLLYSVGYMDHSHAQNRFYFFFLTMIGGLIGVALSKDLFSFFGFWEIMSSWALYFTIVHEETREALREGFKYFIFNYAGATLMFFGVLILSVATGTFEFSLLGERAATMSPAQLTVALLLITAGFLMKAAMLPFRIDYQMHPPAAPTPVSGYISSVLLKSAPFGIMKLLYATIGVSLIAKLSGMLGIEIREAMAWVGGLTILWAVAMALLQSDMKKLLIYHTVSQMGYIVLGVSLGTALGVAGGLLHMVNHMFFKNLLFLGAGAIIYRTGFKSLDEVGGLAKKMPVTTLVFAIGAFSIAGIPPFSGFVSKWLIYQAAMEQGETSLALISLIASVLTMASFVKFLHSAFFGQLPEKLSQVREVPATMLAPMVVLAGLCILFGAVPGLPLSFIAKIQREIGQPAIDPNLFNLYSANGLWSLGILVILLVVGGLISMAVYSAYSRKVRYTEVYTCGNVDLKPEELQVSSHHLYETPKQLIKSELVGLKRLFGQDRGQGDA
ncbi:proton-conducting transporter membrane subunit [Desulfosporosinus burensis]